MWEVVEIEKQPRQLEGTGSGSRVQFKEGALPWRVVPVSGPSDLGNAGVAL